LRPTTEMVITGRRRHVHRFCGVNV